MAHDVGILGGGRMARGLGWAWAAAGHRVVLGSRDPEALAARMAAGRPAALALGTQAEAAQRAVVVLAVPFAAAADLVCRWADALAGRTIVDITNPFGAAPAGRSGIAVHAEALGRPARWAAAFKTNFAATIGAPDGVRRQCLIAAGDAEARATAADLAVAAGFEPVDCGGLEHALALDLMVPLMLELDGRHGGGAHSHWRYVAEAAGARPSTPSGPA